ncbi:ankyrin repeat-containing domain protein [Lactifluus volemus]|nr:ankyrin repeat-containing domain protein [Lactifluus volemus]
MTEMLGKLMAEVLCILTLSKKEIKQGILKKFFAKVAGRREIENALQRLDKLTQEETRMTVTSTLQVVDKINRNQSRSALRKWLSPPDPSVNHSIARSRHHEGTATWFFDNISFNEWKSSHSLLWINGKRSGKSTLCSSIVENIKDTSNHRLGSICYFYFDYKDTSKRDIRGLLSSLLIQLCDQSHHFWGLLSRLYDTHNNGREQPTEEKLMKCLKDMLNLDERLPVYIIIDALDECLNNPPTSSPRRKVLDLLEDLVKSHFSRVHILVTSRDEHDIRHAFQSLPSLHITLHDQGGQKDDIVNYVKFMTHSHKDMQKWRSKDRDLVIQRLSEGANGMFRWVALQLDRLCQAFSSSIRKILDDLPVTLDETYIRILQDIPEEKWEHANRILQCVFVSTRPLQVEELAEVLAVQFEAEDIPDLITDWRLDDPEDALLSACSSLIAIVSVNNSRVVEFSHFSVKEFLISNRLSTSPGRNLSRYHIAPEPAHIILAQACLGTLLHLGDEIDDNGLKEYPLALYAAFHWMDHAQFGNVSSSIRVGMEQLFDSSKPHFSTWIQICDMDGIWGDFIDSWGYFNYEWNKPPIGTPLYYAAGCGFHSLAKQLITVNPQLVNAASGYHGFPLIVASYMGYLDVMGLLREHGADINAKDPHGMTPLHTASERRKVKTMKFLLENGADIDSRNDDDDTPLGMASLGGTLEVVQLLVERGADVNARGSFGRTPLHYAFRTGKLNSLSYGVYNPEVAHFLLQHNADVHARDDDGATALHFVSSEGYLKAAEFLLESGADVNAHDNGQCTPLYYVSNPWHSFLHGSPGNGLQVGMAQLLLKHGALVHTRNKSNETPLQVMLKRGESEVAKLLMEYGAKE